MVKRWFVNPKTTGSTPVKDPTMLYYFSVEKYLENLYLYKNRNMLKINPELEEDYTVIEEFLKTFSLARTLYTFKKGNSFESRSRLQSFLHRGGLCNVKSTYNLSFFYLKSKYNNRTSILFGRDKKLLLNFREISLKYFENVFFVNTLRVDKRSKVRKSLISSLSSGTSRFVDNTRRVHNLGFINVKHLITFSDCVYKTYGNINLYDNYRNSDSFYSRISALFLNLRSGVDRSYIISAMSLLHKYIIVCKKKSNILSRYSIFSLHGISNSCSSSPRNLLIFIKLNNRLGYRCIVILRKFIFARSRHNLMSGLCILFLMFLSSLLFIYKKKKLINSTRSCIFRNKLSIYKLSTILSNLKFIKSNIYSSSGSDVCLHNSNTITLSGFENLYNFINIKNNGLLNLVYRDVESFDNNFINNFKILNNSFIKFKEFLPFFWDKLFNYNKPRLLFVFINTKQSLIKFLKHKRVRSIKRNRFKTLSFYNNKEYLLS